MRAVLTARWWRCLPASVRAISCPCGQVFSGARCIRPWVSWIGRRRFAGAAPYAPCTPHGGRLTLVSVHADRSDRRRHGQVLRYRVTSVRVWTFGWMFQVHAWTVAGCIRVGRFFFRLCVRLMGAGDPDLAGTLWRRTAATWCRCPATSRQTTSRHRWSHAEYAAFRSRLPEGLLRVSDPPSRSQARGPDGSWHSWARPIRRPLFEQAPPDARAGGDAVCRVRCRCGPSHGRRGVSGPGR